MQDKISPSFSKPGKFTFLKSSSLNCDNSIFNEKEIEENKFDEFKYHIKKKKWIASFLLVKVKFSNISFTSSKQADHQK